MTGWVGKALGPYEILALLGAGGMGEVYRARDTKLDRDVAIKVLPEDFAADAERLARFTREAKLLASLNHPNIAGVYGLEDEGDTRFIAMELVEGETLADRIARSGRIDVDEALDIGRQIAEGLEAAHDNGVIHRDLKPANVIVTADGKAKVLDFGLAKAAVAEDGNTGGSLTHSPTATVAATEAGVLLGTAPYMSPEQAKGKVLDKRTDIWAFGCVVYEMLTGKRPFQGENVTETLAAVLKEEPDWALVPSDRPPLIRLVRRCLNKDPRQRLRDIGDARLDLGEALDRSGAHEVEGTGAGASASRPGSLRVERLAWLGSILLVAALVWGVRSSDESAVTPWTRAAPLTETAAVEREPVISPDGNSFYFVSAAAGSDDIYWRRVAGGPPQMVVGDPSRHEGGPAFSPDGERLAYHVFGTESGVYVSGEMGENPRKVAEQGFNPSWSPDGTSIAYSAERTVQPSIHQAGDGLWVVSVDGESQPQLLAEHAMQPAWSPNGSRIAFWAVTGGQRDVFTIDVNGGDPRPLMEDEAVDWSPTWSPDGQYLYFSSSRGGSMGVWRVRVDEATGEPLGAPETVTLGTRASWPSLSADGARLLFHSASDVSVNPVAAAFDPETGALGPPRFLFEQTGTLILDGISPDGEWLAYTNTGEPQEDLFVSRSDGSELRQITDGAPYERRPRWSPDSERLVFYSHRMGTLEVWTIGRDGGGLTQVSDVPEHGYTFSFFSPDGAEIFAIPFPVGAVHVFDAHADEPRTPIEVIEPPDGGFYLFGVEPGGTRLAGNWFDRPGGGGGFTIYDLETGDWRQVLDRPIQGSLAWLPGSERILFAEAPTCANASNRLLVLDLETGREEQLARLPFDIFGPVIAPDGRTVYVSACSTAADVWMLERGR